MEAARVSVVQELFPIRHDSLLSALLAGCSILTRQPLALMTLLLLPGALLVDAAVVDLAPVFGVSDEEEKLWWTRACYLIVWIVFMLSSIWCTLSYVVLLVEDVRNWPRLWRLWKEQGNSHGKAFVIQTGALVFTIGLLSLYTLYHVYTLAQDKIFPSGRSFVSAATVVRVVQRFMASVFMAAIFPVGRKWANKLSPLQEKTLAYLLPARAILLIYRLVFSFHAFREEYTTTQAFLNGVHIINFVFRSFSLLWLTLIVVYVASDFNLNREVRTCSTGACMIAPSLFLVSRFHYPRSSELVVRSGRWIGLKPSSNISTSTSHCRYQRLQSEPVNPGHASDDLRERLHLLRSLSSPSLGASHDEESQLLYHAVMHEHFRIAHRELV